MRKILNREKVLEVCDVGERGREIIESTSFKSQQSYNPRRGLRVANILCDQFNISHFEGKKIIELGPGHYAFALLAQYLGAEVICIERDPTFVKLGRYLGFQVYEMDFADIDLDKFGQPFDGLWMKGSFNACTYKNEDAISEFVNRITNLIAPDGWGWMVTVNKTTVKVDNPEKFAQHRIEIQRQAFEAACWDISLIREEDRPRYALNYTGGLYYFTRKLNPPGDPLLKMKNQNTSLFQGKKTQVESNFFKYILSTLSEVPASTERAFNAVQKLWKPTPEYFLSPWDHYVEFINICRHRQVKFLTMSQALAGEYDSSEINLLLDHHIDFYPIETEVMCRWELENGVISNIYLFNQSPYVDTAQRKIWKVEDINLDFYRSLEKAGFEIGYHQNAIGIVRANTLSRDYETNFDEEILEQARKVFSQDIDNLRRYFNIRTFIPHGAGEGNARLIDLPSGYEDVTWVYNNSRRNGTASPPLKWKNYSDSSGQSPQRIRGYRGEYVARRGNLHLAAWMLSPGLNHVLVHPGRFAKGMPYHLYSGSPKDLEYLSIQEEYRFSDNSCVAPIHVTHLASRWLVSSENLNQLWDSAKESQEELTTLANLQQGFLFTDEPTVVMNWLTKYNDLIPVLVIYRKLSSEERKQVAVERPITKVFKVPEASCPTGLSFEEFNNRFLEEFIGFYNLLYSDRLLQHLSESGIKIKGLVLKGYQTERFLDAQYIVKVLSQQITSQSKIDVCIFSSTVNLKSWQKKFKIAWQQAGELVKNFQYQFDASDDTWTLEIWS